MNGGMSMKSNTLVRGGGGTDIWAGEWGTRTARQSC